VGLLVADWKSSLDAEFPEYNAKLHNVDPSRCVFEKSDIPAKSKTYFVKFKRVVVLSTKEQIGIRLKCRTKRKIYTIRQQLIYILMHSMKNYLYVNCKSSLFYSR
jgi:hypothetical protein